MKLDKETMTLVKTLSEARAQVRRIRNTNPKCRDYALDALDNALREYLNGLYSDYDPEVLEAIEEYAWSQFDYEPTDTYCPE